MSAKRPPVQAPAEDDDTSLLEVPNRPERDVRLGDLPHRDRGLDAGRDAGLLQEVLQGKTVHHDAEHSHVVGTRAVHPATLELSATEEVATTHHHSHLDSSGGCGGDLLRDATHDIRVEPHLAPAECLAGDLEKNPLVGRARCFGGHGASKARTRRMSRESSTTSVMRNGQDPTRNRANAFAVAPDSSRTVATVFLASLANACSSRTFSLKKPLSRPSMILARAASGLPSSLACLLYTSPSPRDRQKSRMPSSA